MPSRTGRPGALALPARLPLTAALSLAGALALAGPVSAQDAEEPCPSLSGATRAWTQTALDGWGRIDAEILRRPRAPLAWAVFFDASCTYHLSPQTDLLPDKARRVDAGLRFRDEPVPTFALPHDSSVRIPDGRAIPAGITSFTSVHGEERTPFFVMSLPELLYEAAGEEDPARRDSLVGAVLDHVDQRRARFFGEEETALSRLEDLLLIMEGVAGWAAHRLGELAPEAVVARRSRDPERMQDERFALFRVLESVSAGWRDPVFSPEPPSPFSLLEAAVEVEGGSCDCSATSATRR